MLQLIAKLREFLAATGLSLTSLLSIIKMVTALGLPPALTDKEGFKNWVKKVADTLASVAALTANVADDQLAALLLRITSNETAWEIFYGIIEKLMPADGVFKSMSDEDLAFAAQQVADALIVDGEEMKGISPALILGLFKLISMLSDLFKQ